MAAERIHPADSPPFSGENLTHKPVPPPTEKPIPQPGGAYVIQIPKDQIYRVPPPENARRYAHLSKRKANRSPCCRFCCCLLTTILTLLLVAAVAAAVIYFVFKPESPNYSVESLAIKGFNLTSTSSPLSPQFDVTVRAHNPNDKIGIYYEKGSSVKVYYEDVNLCHGVLPAFYQPTNNVTLFKTALKGSGIELTTAALRSLSNEQNRKTVPFTLKLRAPVKIKVGSIKTWKITAKVTCKITVDKLTASSKIMSKDCDYGVNLW